MPRRPDVLCSGGCGELLWRGPKSLDQPKCLACRSRDGDWSTGAANVIRSSGTRTLTITCELCGESETYPWAPRRRQWCSTCCPRRSNGKRAGLPDPNPGGSSWISRERRIGIYVRDAWTCQVCDILVLRQYVAGDDRSPTLDHVTPQSVVPDHSDGNLRTACVLCNNVRGAARLSDPEVRAIVWGRRGLAKVAA